MNNLYDLILRAGGLTKNANEEAGYIIRDGLTIKSSPIEGLGLFATTEIKANSFIGVTHIRDEQFDNKYIRTPLGGFIITQMIQQ